MTPTISTSRLHWDQATGTFSAEASDLGWSAGSWPTEVLVCSHTTKDSKLFSLKEIEKDSEGEVTAAKYICEGWTLQIFND